MYFTRYVLPSVRSALHRGRHCGWGKEQYPRERRDQPHHHRRVEAPVPGLDPGGPPLLSRCSAGLSSESISLFTSSATRNQRFMRSFDFNIPSIPIVIPLDIRKFWMNRLFMVYFYGWTSHFFSAATIAEAGHQGCEPFLELYELRELRDRASGCLASNLRTARLKNADLWLPLHDE